MTRSDLLVRLTVTTLLGCVSGSAVGTTPEPPLPAMTVPWSPPETKRPPPTQPWWSAEGCERFHVEYATPAQTRLDELRESFRLQSAREFNGPSKKADRKEFADVLTRYEDALSEPPAHCAGGPVRKPPTKVVKVRIAYLTDRDGSGGKIPGEPYGTKRRKSGLQAGLIDVLVAPNRECREIPSRGEGYEVVAFNGTKLGDGLLGDGREVSLPQIEDAFSAYQTLRHNRGDKSRLLVYVHGFNNTFSQAAVLATKLATCLGGDVYPLLVSWPSASKLLSYALDEDVVSASQQRLKPVVDWLAQQTGFDEVMIVAHSMGARLSVRLLNDFSARGGKFPKLTKFILAAPDMAPEEFAEDFPAISALPKFGTTVYVSNNDIALLASSTVHRMPRLGDARPIPFTLAGLETIDASDVNSRLVALGHTYVVHLLKVREDIRLSAINRVHPDRRGLLKKGEQGKQYWTFP